MSLLNRITDWVYLNLNVENKSRSLNIDNDTDSDSSGMRLTITVPETATIEDIRKAVFNNPWYVPGSPLDLNQQNGETRVSFKIISRLQEKQVKETIKTALAPEKSPPG